TPFKVQAGCLIRCRILGMLNMTDEAGRDSKLLAVPIEKVCRQFAHIQTLEDIPQITRDSIVHFFEHYKDLEADKWVKLEGWAGKEAAAADINKAIESYR
ncbi:MAG: inorganic diphosphatase, partial [Coxiellaceae bacterium]|nr:inorganic diphosphatase [Coxiellaceae bacterium]